METPRSLFLSALAFGVLGLGATGCASDGPSGAAGSGDESRHVHSDDHHHDADGGHGDEGHADPSSLQQALLEAGDLPEGYVAGAGHHHAPSSSGAAPDMAPSCLSVARLIGVHPKTQQADHPQARVSFSKSHFGPEITETVVDYGDEELAEEELRRVERAQAECTLYRQTTGGPGASAYRVVTPTALADLDDGARVSMRADGADFAGISWEIWVSQVDGRLISVALRTARGGEPEDLGPAVEAAVRRLQQS